MITTHITEDARQAVLYWASRARCATLPGWQDSITVAFLKTLTGLPLADRVILTGIYTLAVEAA